MALFVVAPQLIIASHSAAQSRDINHRCMVRTLHGLRVGDTTQTLPAVFRRPAFPTMLPT